MIQSVRRNYLTLFVPGFRGFANKETFSLLRSKSYKITILIYDAYYEGIFGMIYMKKNVAVDKLKSKLYVAWYALFHCALLWGNTDYEFLAGFRYLFKFFNVASLEQFRCQ